MNAMIETSTFSVDTLPMPIIESVEPGKEPLQIWVTWAKGIRPKGRELIDLTPLIGALKFYRRLRTDKKMFKTVHVIEDGNAIAWGAGSELDMASTSVERLAEEGMTSHDFAAFLQQNDLTHGEAAAVLGRSRRQIEYYLSGEKLIPRIVALACEGYIANKSRSLRPNRLLSPATNATIPKRTQLMDVVAG